MKTPPEFPNQPMAMVCLLLLCVSNMWPVLVWLHNGSSQNGTLHNGTLHHGTLQNGTSQNECCFKKVRGIKQSVTKWYCYKTVTVTK
jgi:hypothetical protein